MTLSLIHIYNVMLTWEGAADAYSGLARMEYAVDGGAWEALDVNENGSREIEIGGLADGEHQMCIRDRIWGTDITPEGRKQATMTGTEGRSSVF